MTNNTNATPATMTTEQKFYTNCFGCSKDELLADYGPTSANWKLCGGALMLAASIASDAQHLLGLGQLEQVRILLNRQKWVIAQSNAIEREREHSAKKNAVLDSVANLASSVLLAHHGKGPVTVLSPEFRATIEKLVADAIEFKAEK
jgi:hypothetical protein